MTEDSFITSVLLYCDDCDRYHTYALWREGDTGGHYLTDSSGDTYPLTEDELTPEAIRESENDYYQSVAEGGPDYLNLVHVQTFFEQEWHFRFCDQNGKGLRFEGARANGKGEWLMPEDLPKDVVDWLTLDKDVHGNPLPRVSVFKTTSEAERVALVDHWNERPSGGIEGVASITIWKSAEEITKLKSARAKELINA